MRTNGQTHVTNPTTAFRNFEKAPKNGNEIAVTNCSNKSPSHPQPNAQGVSLERAALRGIAVTLGDWVTRMGAKC